MKYVALIVAAIVLHFQSLAQPVLTSAILPNPGDSFTICKTYAGSFLLGSGGVNIDWDFSGLVPYMCDTLNYQLCDSPFNCASYPTNNITAREHFSKCNYYIKSADSFTIIAQTDYNMDADRYCDDPETLLKFPLVYGQAFTDSFKCIKPTHFVKAADTCLYDGYGRLTLPNGVYDSVVRLHTSSAIIDTQWDWTGPGTRPTRYKTETYSWYGFGIHHPLLVIKTSTGIGASAPFDRSASYISRYLTAEVGDNNLPHPTVVIYPNPAENQFTIRASKVQSWLAVYVYDMSGREVIHQSCERANTVVLDAPVTSGIYVVKVVGDGDTFIQKLVVGQ